MADPSDRAIERTIRAMYERSGELHTIDELARIALLSKFHYSRLFRDFTGTSPGRFQCALRLSRAKQMLASTGLSIAEISNQVGYSSLGTFGVRFKIAVGVTPTYYRKSHRRLERVPVDRAPLNGSTACPGPNSATVRGRVLAPGVHERAAIFIGLFPEPILQGPPAAWCLLGRPGPYVLTGAPPGTWYTMARTVTPGWESIDAAGLRAVQPASAHAPPPAVGSGGPMTLGAGVEVEAGPLHLRPMRLADPPPLLALPVAWTDYPVACGS